MPPIAKPATAASSSPSRSTLRRRRLGLGAGPLVAVVMLLLPAPEGLSTAAWRTAAAVLWIAIWWMTEALPIPATSLLPLVLLPLFGAGSLREVAAPYSNPLIFLFLGGFLVALAMERWGLHRRLALHVLVRVGNRPRGVLIGFMLASATLSMWISNTATAMMMLPIGVSVVELLSDTDEGAGNLGTALFLAIAYASSVGGLGTLIGTPPNALLAGFLLQSYGHELSFARWMLIGLPVVVAGLIVVFVVLSAVYPVGRRPVAGGRALFARRLADLGPTSREERIVGAVFVLIALLWLTRRWFATLLPGLSDAAIAIFGALLLFAAPSNWRRGRFVLDWSVAPRLPWGVLLLFGGGLSLASQIQSTGLADWIGGRLSGLASWPPLLLTAVVMLVILFLTELTSNTATTAAFLPVVGSLATATGLEPMTLLVPATLAASCAFMLPVATPPNAVVYAAGHVTLPQMMRAGVWLNFCLLVVLLAISWLLVPIVFAGGI